MNPSAPNPPTRTIYILPAGAGDPSKPTVYRPVRVARVANVNLVRPSPPLASPPSTIHLIPSSPPMVCQKPARAPKRPLVAEDINDLIEHKNPNAVVPRKRERLTHLSREEKLQRRKLKNREAAQAARDRKKDRTGKLEHSLLRVVAEVREKDEIIARHEATIRSQREENARLREELDALRCQLSGAALPPPATFDVQKMLGTPSEPAEFANPLPRDGVPTPMALMRLCEDLFAEKGDVAWPFVDGAPSADAALCLPSTSTAPLLQDPQPQELGHLTPWSLHQVPSPGAASLHYATSPSFDDLYPESSFLGDSKEDKFGDEESFLDAITPLIADDFPDLDEFMRLPIY
ncbi:hypothetical protein QR680_012662 [Steinernema hermaphroditum]|uniref:X-box-binding protein 1 n=1 Tax=Steinernema hermaphroditum TaxID=289476 RepID=A0AA39I5J0_9BILA|nr:hypothetical protein QR680_012662 [Steinernema hermaphroditum]